MVLLLSLYLLVVHLDSGGDRWHPGSWTQSATRYHCCSPVGFGSYLAYIIYIHCHDGISRNNKCIKDSYFECKLYGKTSRGLISFLFLINKISSEYNMTWTLYYYIAESLSNSFPWCEWNGRPWIHCWFETLEGKFKFLISDYLNQVCWFKISVISRLLLE